MAIPLIVTVPLSTVKPLDPDGGVRVVLEGPCPWIVSEARLEAEIESASV